MLQTSRREFITFCTNWCIACCTILVSLFDCTEFFRTSTQRTFLLSLPSWYARITHSLSQLLPALYELWVSAVSALLFRYMIPYGIFILDRSIIGLGTLRSSNFSPILNTIVTHSKKRRRHRPASNSI